jgi:hypothetical protein
MKNFKSIFTLIYLVLFASSASFAVTASQKLAAAKVDPQEQAKQIIIAQQKQLDNLKQMLYATQLHYASVGLFNTQYAQSICGANYAKTSAGLSCATKSLQTASYKNALNIYNKGYTSETVIQHTIYDLKNNFHGYSDSNFSLGR